MPKKKLLILGPSFRRKKSLEALPAIERYDGIFFRIARKYRNEDVDIMILNDDLVLIKADELLPYSPPRGQEWKQRKFLKKIDTNKVRKRNEEILTRVIQNYSEVFLAMGKQFAKALPDLSKYGVKVVFPTSGGIGPKARELVNWLTDEEK